MKTYLFNVLMLISFISIGQSVTIVPNGTPENPSAQLILEGNQAGLQLQRVGTTARGLMAHSPGLMVFDIDLNAVFMSDGYSWREIPFTPHTGYTFKTFQTPYNFTNYELLTDGAILDEQVILGRANMEYNGESDYGDVLIYSFSESSGWLADTLIKPADHKKQEFGKKVEITSTSLFVASPRDMDAGNTLENVGSIYEYRKDGQGKWQFHTKLYAPAPQLEMRFGEEMIAKGDFLVARSRANPAGRLHVFKKQNTGEYQQIQEINAPVNSLNATFGKQIALNGNMLLVSASEYQNGAANSGAAFLFSFSANQFQLIATILPNQIDNMKFGSSLALTFDRLFIGSRLNNSSELEGNIHVYTIFNQNVALSNAFGTGLTYAVPNGGFGFRIIYDNNFLFAYNSDVQKFEVFKKIPNSTNWEFRYAYTSRDLQITGWNFSNDGGKFLHFSKNYFGTYYRR